MHIEASRSQVDFQQIWRQTTVRNVRAREERESMKVKLFNSIRESIRVYELEAKRQREFQLPSIGIKI